MSAFSIWCVISGILFFNFLVYKFANSHQTEQLGKSNSKDRALDLPENVWGQFAFRGIFFVLGSIFFTAITAIVFLIIKSISGPLEGAAFAFTLSSWLGGLCCATLTRIGAKISYWTAWVLEGVTL
jgi:hypothetical protein